MKRFLFFFIFWFSCTQNPVDVDAPFAPAESPVPRRIVSNKTPPANFKNCLAWAQALYNPALGSPAISKVEMDYLRFYGMYGSVKKLIACDEFDVFLPNNGLYTKIPWYGSKVSSMPGVVENGILILDLATQKPYIWHWWTVRPELVGVPDYVVIEARIRLSGNACFQLGGDWYLNGTVKPEWNVTVKEIGASDWYGPAENWQIIEFYGQ